jgi:two-component system OmpR family response regulator
MVAMRALIVEPDAMVSSFVRKGLESDGHVVDVLRSGSDGLARALEVEYDLLLLDLVLPDLDGRQLLARLREAGRRTPAIVLSAALTSVDERVAALDAGADDVLVKPFSFVELQARIRALKRRFDGRFERTLRVGPFALDTVRHSATRGDRPIELTPREYQLLEFFMRHAREVVSRATLAERVWGASDGGSNVIDVYVTYLRKKVGGGQTTIRTVRGVGYVFDPQP